ncbi:hypothetical protein I4641_13695 [Waterburya agarophytonicola K14]|uniref:Uncharacterized protein n=1 Tax=Waterburya agarophytonicola KI4 TaxID=2874699 RepID=A0A964FI42_9CYAN|nr:hypothetical protein [Waterburya agarophytonicola]MCC0178033.1 hypothetical protein [Waterburya agarophytonicola KI4]
MATNNKNKLENTFASKRSKSSSAESARRVSIPTKGAEAFFDTADNTAKQVEAENTDDQKVEPKPTPEIAPKKQTKTTAASSKKKKTAAAKTKSAPAEEKKEGGELIKTSIYIEEENFLDLEELQLKLKRKEKRRVTKNELFNKAIGLLIKHYSD